MFRSSSLDNGRPGNARTASRAVAAGPAAAIEAAAEQSTQIGPLVRLTLPALVTNIGQTALLFTSYTYTGQLSDAVALAGLGLGISFCNITGACVYYGMGTGIEVLCSQAFGAKEYRLVGVTFARGTLLTAVVSIPVAVLWFEMGNILLTIGQQEDIAHTTGAFCRGYLWGMIPYAVYENLKRCLQAQNVTTPAMVVVVLGAAANVIFHHVTMVVWGMGVYGAGLALSFTGVFMLFALVFSTWVFRLGARGCWSGLCTLDVFKKWPEYMKESAPGLMSTFIEWTSWEATILFAGFLGEEALATQVIALSAYGIVFQFALSINIAVSTRVGNLVGEGEEIGARKSTWCAVCLGVVVAAISTLGLGLARSQWPRLYGAPEDVIDMIVSITPIYLAAQMIDMVQMVCTGVLTGMGYRGIQAKAAIGFWVVGVPSSWFLGVHLGWGLQGLWAGMAIVEAPLLLFYLYTLRTAKWDKCVQEAVARLNTQSDRRLPETAPGSPTDTDSEGSDSEGAGGGAAAAPSPGGGAAEGPGDEEVGYPYGYSGAGGGAMARAVSGGERVERPTQAKSGEKMPLLLGVQGGGDDSSSSSSSISIDIPV